MALVVEAVGHCDFLGGRGPRHRIHHLSLDRSAAATSLRNRRRYKRIRLRRLCEAIRTHTRSRRSRAGNAQLFWRGRALRCLTQCCVRSAGGHHHFWLHGTARCGDTLFARWNIGLSDIHFLQEHRAHYAVRAIPWQAPIHWNVDDGVANAYVGGIEGY